MRHSHIWALMRTSGMSFPRYLPQSLQSSLRRSLPRLVIAYLRVSCVISCIDRESKSEQEIRLQIDTNVVGPMVLTQALLPGMRSRKSGTIVNISSIAGQDALPAASLYAGSKFFLEGKHLLVSDAGLACDQYSLRLRRSSRCIGIAGPRGQPAGHSCVDCRTRRLQDQLSIRFRYPV